MPSNTNSGSFFISEVIFHILKPSFHCKVLISLKVSIIRLLTDWVLHLTPTLHSVGGGTTRWLHAPGYMSIYGSPDACLWTPFPGSRAEAPESWPSQVHITIFKFLMGMFRIILVWPQICSPSVSKLRACPVEYIDITTNQEKLCARFTE